MIIAQSIPAKATLFLNYIITQTLIIYPLFLLIRIDTILITLIRLLFLNPFGFRTPKIILRACYPNDFTFFVQYPRELLIFTIVVTYSIMCPLAPTIAAFCFTIVYYMMKYNFLYVYRFEHKEFNLVPPSVYSIIFTVLFFHLAMVGVLSLKLFPWGTATLIGTAGAIYVIRHLFLTYHAGFHVIPQTLCKEFVIEPQSIEEIKISYTHPTYKLLKAIEMDRSQYNLDMPDKKENGSENNVNLDNDTESIDLEKEPIKVDIGNNEILNKRDNGVESEKDSNIELETDNSEIQLETESNGDKETNGI